MGKKRVVITGGAGFIGSNIAEMLCDDNEIIIIDDLSSGKVENIANITDRRNVKFIQDSILNLKMLEKYFQGIDIVFHEAAITSVMHSIEDPISANEVNIKGTLNVLIAAKKSKVKKVIFASSAAVYGEATILPVKENMIPHLQSPYAVTKLTGEYYCQLFTELYGLPTICLRYFNVYGPGQDQKSEYSAVIPSFINSVLNGRPPVIYGDGNQTRDFVFIKDIIKANFLAAESKETGVLNIGSGQKNTISELAYQILRIIGSDLRPTYKEARIGEIKHSVADLTLANSIGYYPEYTLENGLCDIIRNFQRKTNINKCKLQ